MNAGEHTSWILGRETTWGVEPMRSFPLDVFGKKLNAKTKRPQRRRPRRNGCFCSLRLCVCVQNVLRRSEDATNTPEILLLSQKHSGSEFTIKKETAMNFEIVVDY